MFASCRGASMAMFCRTLPIVAAAMIVTRNGLLPDGKGPIQHRSHPLSPLLPPDINLGVCGLLLGKDDTLSVPETICSITLSTYMERCRIDLVTGSRGRNLDRRPRRRVVSSHVLLLTKGLDTWSRKQGMW